MKRTVLALAISFSLVSAVTPAMAGPVPTTPSDVPSSTTPPVSGSGDTPALQEARSRYHRGVDLYQEGDYKLALIEFQRSFELAPSYKILYNIGEVHFQLNNYASALKALEKYLAEGGNDVPGKRRVDVEKDIGSLKTRVAHLTIKANVAGAEIYLDDVLVGKTPLSEELLVDAGTRKITATLAGRTPALRNITLAGQDSKVVELKLEALGGGPVAVAPPNYGAYIGWGATGLFTVGAIATGVLAASANSKLSDLKGQKGVTAQQLQDKDSERKTFSLTSDVLAGTALVAAGIALYFTIKGTRAPEPKRESAYVRPFLAPSAAGVVGVW